MFLQVRWPNQQCQSTEEGWLVIQIALNLTRLISPCAGCAWAYWSSCGSTRTNRCLECSTEDTTVTCRGWSFTGYRKFCVKPWCTTSHRPSTWSTPCSPCTGHSQLCTIIRFVIALPWSCARKLKGPVLVIAFLTWVRLVTRSALQFIYLFIYLFIYKPHSEKGK